MKQQEAQQEKHKADGTCQKALPTATLWAHLFDPKLATSAALAGL